MNLNQDKIDEVVLALLHLTLHDTCRAWKNIDWDAMDRPHAKGLIENPANKTKSVVLTDEGLKLAEKFAQTYFSSPTNRAVSVRYGGRVAKSTPAGGASGILCSSATDAGYFFRALEPDGSFTDYDLRHDDLEITVHPEALAAFYDIGEDHILDHSPEVLGLEQKGSK